MPFIILISENFNQTLYQTIFKADFCEWKIFAISQERNNNQFNTRNISSFTTLMNNDHNHLLNSTTNQVLLKYSIGLTSSYTKRHKEK